MFNIISKLIGDSNEKALKKIQPLLAEVNSLENKYISLSHTELKSSTEKLEKLRPEPLSVPPEDYQS